MIDVREEVMTTGRSSSRRPAKNNAPARGMKPAKGGKTLPIARVFSDAATKTSAKPDQYSKLKDSKTIVIDGDYDVFGDKSVTLISTPGHTPGHQCLLVRLPKTGPVLLSGDLYHFPGEREFHTFPTGSNADYVASRAKVEALLKSTGAQLWIQHDMISNHKLKKSPQYYE